MIYRFTEEGVTLSLTTPPCPFVSRSLLPFPQSACVSINQPFEANLFTLFFVRVGG